MMKIEVLNAILSFVECEYAAADEIVASGQRHVYRAIHKTSGVPAVIKLCPLQPVAVARIQREIKILSEIDSPYFPKFYFQFFATDEEIGFFIENLDPEKDANVIENLPEKKIKPFLITVEEFIEHIPWKDCAKSLKDEKRLVDLLIHLFEGMNLLWDKKIVHRDLKPDNILLRPNLHPVIIDLGIAKSFGEGTMQLTHPLMSSPCTPHFASPEQLQNRKAEVTYKSDQFSLGVISFLVVVGQFPYGDCDEIGPEAVVQNILQRKMVDARTIAPHANPKLVGLIEKLLKLHPYERYRTVEEILQDLRDMRSTL